MQVVFFVLHVNRAHSPRTARTPSTARSPHGVLSLSLLRLHRRPRRLLEGGHARLRLPRRHERSRVDVVNAFIEADFGGDDGAADKYFEAQRDAFRAIAGAA